MAIDAALRGSVPLLALLLSSGHAALGQDVPSLNLQIDREISVAGQAALGTMNPIKCDARANIYLRFYQVRFYSSPVVKFSPEGERKAIFSTESVPGWEEADVYDFAVGPGADVYLLAGRLAKNSKFEFAVVSFDEDGQHRFTTQVKVPFDSVDHLAVFSTGEFVIGGHRELEGSTPQNTESSGSGAQKKESKNRKVEPVIAIVDRNGNLIQQAELPIESSSDAAASTGAQRVLAASAISLGSTAMGDDGNLYLMFQTDRPTVYAISAAGAVVRTLKITPPSERAVALEVGIASGVGLIVKFAERGEGSFYPGDKTIFSLVDRQTGERLYDYRSSMRLGPALGCYTPKGLLFLGATKEGQFALLRAVPR